MKKSVTLTADASKGGLSAACLQDDQPIAYASRALTPAEVNCLPFYLPALGFMIMFTARK